MATLADFPNELLLQILSYDVLDYLIHEVGFDEFTRRYSTSERLLRIATEVFFNHYIQVVGIWAFSDYAFNDTRMFHPRKTSSSDICACVRELNVRLVSQCHNPRLDCTTRLLQEELQRYPRLQRVHVSAGDFPTKVGCGSLSADIQRIVDEAEIKLGRKQELVLTL